jgi:predicted TIM-barrel fold metal-dependent hydrolase
MYSADYPFEDPVEAGAFMTKLPLDAAVLDDISYHNAARLLRIGTPS